MSYMHYEFMNKKPTVKDFSYSKYPSREIKEFHSDFAEKENTRCWKTAAKIVCGIAIMELISFVIIPYFFGV